MKCEDLLRSPNGRYHLIYQEDGNLVLYEGRHALWASETDGTSVGRTLMQKDGRLVIYSSGGSRPIWASHRDGGNGSYYLKLQDDGNLVIYNLTEAGLVAVWATDTDT